MRKVFLLFMLYMIFLQGDIISQINVDLSYKKILRGNACSIISIDTLDLSILESETWLTYAVAEKCKKRKVNTIEVDTVSFGLDYMNISNAEGKDISCQVEYSESRIIIIPHEQEKICYDVCELNEKYFKAFVYVFEEGKWKKISKILFISI